MNHTSNMSNQVLTKANWIEAQRSQTAMLPSLKENKTLMPLRKAETKHT